MKYYISPPIGMRTGYKNGIRVMGTYTRHPRPGWWSQTFRTLRPAPGGWVNKIGLRNPGIDNAEFIPNRVYSIAALKYEDWDYFLERIPCWVKLEINQGCPNTETCEISAETLARFTAKYNDVAVKYGPFEKIEAIKKHHEVGVRRIHLSNTLPMKKGGLSGEILRDTNLPFVQAVRKLYPRNLDITAGGGVYTPEDVSKYVRAGATSISLSTVFFTPWKVSAVVRRIESC